MDSAPVWVIVLASIATVAASVYGARKAGQSSVRVAEIGVEELAFVRARETYEATIRRLETDLTAERQEKHEAIGRLEVVEKQVQLMTKRLREAGIDVDDVLGQLGGPHS